MIQENHAGSVEICVRVGNPLTDSSLAAITNNEFRSSREFVKAATGLVGTNSEISRYREIARFYESLRPLRSRDLARRVPFASQVMGAYDIVCAWESRRLVGLFDDYGMGKTYTALLAFYGWKAHAGEETNSKMLFLAENKPLSRAYEDLVSAGVNRERIFVWDVPNGETESTAGKLKRLQGTKADIIMCPFTAVVQSRFLESLDGGGKGIGQHVVVVDESHELKGAGDDLAVRTKSVRALSSKLSERGARGLLLSATPVVYDLSELGDWASVWRTPTVPVVSRSSEQFFDMPPISTQLYDIQTTLPPLRQVTDSALQQEAEIVTEWAATMLAPRVLLDPRARILFFSPYVDRDTGYGEASLLALQDKLQFQGIRADTLYARTLNQHTATVDFLANGQTLGTTFLTGANSFTFNAEGLNIYIVLLHPPFNPADIPQAIARAYRPIGTGSEPVTVIVPTVSRSDCKGALGERFDRMFSGVDASFEITGNVSSWRRNVAHHSVRFLQSGEKTTTAPTVDSVLGSIVDDLRSLSSASALKALERYREIINLYGDEGALLSTNESRVALRECLQWLVSQTFSAADAYGSVLAVQYITEKLLRVLPNRGKKYNSAVMINEVLTSIQATSENFSYNPAVWNHVIFSVLYGRLGELPAALDKKIAQATDDVGGALKPVVENRRVVETAYGVEEKKQLNAAIKTPTVALPRASVLKNEKIGVSGVGVLAKDRGNLPVPKDLVQQVRDALGAGSLEIELGGGESVYSVVSREDLFSLKNIDDDGVQISVVFNPKTHVFSPAYANRLGGGVRDDNVNVAQLIREVVFPYFDKLGGVRIYESELTGVALEQFRQGYLNLAGKDLPYFMRAMRAALVTFDATRLAIPLGFSIVSALGNSAEGVDIEITPENLSLVESVTTKWITGKTKEREEPRFLPRKYKGITVEFETEGEREQYKLKNGGDLAYLMYASKRTLWLWQNGFVDGHYYSASQLQSKFPDLETFKIRHRIKSVESPMRVLKRVVVPFELGQKVNEFLDSRDGQESQSPFLIMPSSFLDEKIMFRYEMWLLAHGYINNRRWSVGEIASRFKISTDEVNINLRAQMEEVRAQNKIFVPAGMVSSLCFPVTIEYSPGSLMIEDNSILAREERQERESTEIYPFIIDNGKLLLHAPDGPFEDNNWRQVYSVLTYLSLRGITDSVSRSVMTKELFDSLRSRARENLRVYLLFNGLTEDGEQIDRLSEREIASEVGMEYKKVVTCLSAMRLMIEKSAYKQMLIDKRVIVVEANSPLHSRLNVRRIK